MSGLYLLIVVAVWAGLTILLWKGWRRWRARAGAQSRVVDTTGIVLGVLWVGIALWFGGGGQKTYYDMQVNRMCKQDGGVKVFETVKLTENEYDQYAKKNWVLPDKDRAKPDDRYYVETDRHYYREGSPQVTRRQYRIVRRSDGKVLGEMILYGRGGGDLPGPWHGSSFTCPDRTALPNFETSIFIREKLK